MVTASSAVRDLPSSSAGPLMVVDEARTGDESFSG